MSKNMHITDWAQARILARRPGLHPFPAIDPARTALLVVDMQNGFVAEGSGSWVPDAAGVVGRINALAEAVRASGGMVAYTQHLVDDDAVQNWSSYYRHFVGASRLPVLRGTLGPGTSGFALWDGLDVQPGDLVVPKRRFGAFGANSSDLHERLRARGVDSVIVTGTVTNVCCETTAREAMMLDYKVFFVSDANAALTPQEHQATLDNMAVMFGDVRDTESMLGLLQAAVPVR
jgi:ureidoacrylate peracid hydrolase